MQTINNRDFPYPVDRLVLYCYVILARTTFALGRSRPGAAGQVFTLRYFGLNEVTSTGIIFIVRLHMHDE